MKRGTSRQIRREKAGEQAQEDPIQKRENGQTDITGKEWQSH